MTWALYGLLCLLCGAGLVWLGTWSDPSAERLTPARRAAALALGAVLLVHGLLGAQGGAAAVVPTWVLVALTAGVATALVAMARVTPVPQRPGHLWTAQGVPRWEVLPGPGIDERVAERVAEPVIEPVGEAVLEGPGQGWPAPPRHPGARWIDATSALPSPLPPPVPWQRARRWALGAALTALAVGVLGSALTGAQPGAGVAGPSAPASPEPLPPSQGLSSALTPGVTTLSVITGVLDTPGQCVSDWRVLTGPSPAPSSCAAPHQYEVVTVLPRRGDLTAADLTPYCRRTAEATGLRGYGYAGVVVSAGEQVSCLAYVPTDGQGTPPGARVVEGSILDGTVIPV